MAQSLLDKNLAFLIKTNYITSLTQQFYLVIYTKEMEIYVDKYM